MAQPQLVTRFVTPMPTPSSPGAPRFKGECVNEFLDSLEVHANSAEVDLNDLPSYVLRYCSRRVKYVIEVATCWSQYDWAVARAYLIKLYGSNDKKQHITSDKLRRWIKKHSMKKAFNSLQDVDRYYHEFTAQASHLITGSQRSENEANILFFRGIPKPQQKSSPRSGPAQVRANFGGPGPGPGPEVRTGARPGLNWVRRVKQYIFRD